MENKYTPEQIRKLADAVWYALDDMGKDGHSVCEGVKAQLRYYYEPFNDAEEAGDNPDYLLETATTVLKEVDIL